jgi:hypothetical protein
MQPTPVFLAHFVDEASSRGKIACSMTGAGRPVAAEG